VPLRIDPARPADDGHQPLAFVEVTSATSDDRDGSPTAKGPKTAATPGLAATSDPGWSLWGDLEA
jgi:hypothetical protein